MSESWTFYAVAIPAVILLGFAKGGFAGLGTLATPIMALTMSPVRAAAIILPLLIVGDWVSIWAFRKDWDGRNLAILIPASLLGVTIGFGLASHVSEAAVRVAVGLISIGFVAFMLCRDRYGLGHATRADVPSGLFWGSLAGFTSFVSHAGSPPFQVFVQPQNLAPRIFAGTGAVFFAATNLLKVPPYFALGQFSRENLNDALALAPFAVVSTLLGVWLVKRVSAQRFYAAVLILTFVVGLKLTYDGVVELFT